jgi:UDP-N-acetyl-D-glucosamine dehydrogenase
MPGGFGDDRESASIDVLRELEARGANVSVLDPMVSSDRIAHHGFDPVAPGDPLDDYAIAAVLTDHPDLDLERIADAVPVVFDARGAYRKAGLVRDDVFAL